MRVPGEATSLFAKGTPFFTLSCMSFCRLDLVVFLSVFLFYDFISAFNYFCLFFHVCIHSVFLSIHLSIISYCPLNCIAFPFLFPVFLYPYSLHSFSLLTKVTSFRRSLSFLNIHLIFSLKVYFHPPDVLNLLYL